MSDIKATEVVGELKRLRRLYEVLERAEDMVRVLAEQEQRQSMLEKNLAELEAEKVAADKEIDERIAKANKKLADVTHAIKMGEVKIVESEKRAEAIVQKAHDEAKAIEAKGVERVRELSQAIADLESTVKHMKQETELAKEALNRVRADLEAKKQQILQAFN